MKKGNAFKSVNRDSSIYYYNLAIPHLIEDKDWESYIDCYNAMATQHYYKGEIEQAIQNILKANKKAKIYLSDTSMTFIKATINLGAFYRIKNNYNKSIQQFKKAIRLLRKGNNDPDYLSAAYKSIGFSLYKQGDYDQAIINYKKGIEKVLETSQYKKYPDLGTFYSNIGNCFFYKKDYDQAKIYYQKSINFLKSVPQTAYVKSSLLDIYYYIASIYLDEQNFKEAEGILSQTKILLSEKGIQYKYMIYEIYGKLYLKRRKPLQALKSYKTALDLSLEDIGDFKKHPELGRQWMNLSEVSLYNKDYFEAIQHLHKALIIQVFGFDNEDIYRNPKPGTFIEASEGLRALKGKAQSFYQYYHQTQNLKDLKASLDAYEVAHQLIQKTRQDIISRGSKHQLAGQVLAVYEGAIKSAIKLYEVTEDRKYLEKAFFYAENNKAISLLESINENVAKHYGGIPDSLLEKETDWRIDITFYEKQINQEKQKAEKGDPEKIKGWEEIMFELKQQYNDLVKTLEEKYPKYHELKYQMTLTTVADIQKNMLDEQSVFLEYFVGDEKIYLFRITKQDFQVFDFERKAHFEQTVQKLLDAVHYPNKTIEGFAAFKTPAFEVYQHYLSAALQDLPASISRLLIVPDDALGYIPFEVLLREQPGENTQIYSIDALSYLFEDFLINYAYSGTLLERSLKRESKGGLKPFLGFAPSFGQPIAEANRNCSSDELYSLNCSTGEVQAIQTLMGGEVLTGKVADKASFMNLANQYQVIHLATHSCADEQDPRFSKIFFADDYVSNQDLFNLPLQADLAVLSSCNTGSGKLVKGEGVMSLSKGFIHSGCPSTLISLWSVDDCATSDIMVAYYTYLKQGLTKDQALQSAKIEYLQSVDKAQQHPYYWAAFVQMGNFLPLDLGSSWGVPWWAGFVLGLFALLGVWIFRRNGAG